jgi:hypothetical protein
MRCGTLNIKKMNPFDLFALIGNARSEVFEGRNLPPRDRQRFFGDWEDVLGKVSGGLHLPPVTDSEESGGEVELTIPEQVSMLKDAEISLGHDRNEVVLRALRDVEVLRDGKLLKLGPLDRPQYKAADKILASLGGKWSRKKADQGHVFEHPNLMGLLDYLEGRKLAKANPHSHFPTNSAIATDLLENIYSRVKFPQAAIFLEPSAAAGNLIKPTMFRPSPPEEIHAIEIDLQRYTELSLMEEVYAYHGDFLKLVTQARFDMIAINPPFNRMEWVKHVEKALSLLTPGGVIGAIMPASYANLQSQQKRIRWLRETMEGLEDYVCIKLPDDAWRGAGVQSLRTVMVIGRKPYKSIQWDVVKPFFDHVKGKLGDGGDAESIWPMLEDLAAMGSVCDDIPLNANFTNFTNKLNENNLSDASSAIRSHQDH